MWDDLQTKYCFKGILELRTALHIGGGNVNTGYTDSPVVRTPDGTPFIPGSSLKGVLRSTVEKLAVSLPGIKTCQLFDTDTKCPTPDEKTFNTWKTGKPEDQIVARLRKDLCATCKLFGSPYSHSKLTVHDLALQEWAEVTQVRDGVVIDRDSERARDKLKYDYEVVPPGATFALEIWLEHPVDADLALACVAMNELRSGTVHIGGNTSRGLGSCQLHHLEMYELNLKGDDRDARLKHYLLGKTLQDKMVNISDVDTFLEENILPLVS